jgi:2-oxoglutarate dehydrogenase E2 component (dihydrolipoamide succinyltransferase)
MAGEIKVPELGESVVEATVAEWLKVEGDPVKTGEPVVRLETDKVDVEVSAQQDGVLASILRKQGEDVRVGEVLGSIEAGGARVATAEGKAPTTLPAEGARGDGEGDRVPAGRATARAGAEAGGEAARAAAPQPTVASTETPGADEGKVSPLARRVAEELGVDPGNVPAGPSGRVTREDVEAFAAQQREKGRPASQEVMTKAAPRQPAPSTFQPAAAAQGKQPSAAPATGAATIPNRPEERIRFSRRRQTIARRLVEAQQTAAMLTTFNEVDMSAVMAMRAKHKESFKERHGIGLGFMSFFVKASTGALKAFPQVNAELQGDELILKHYYDIGIAIGAEEGLVVPVVRDADRMSFAQIEQAIEALAKKTREGALSLEDLRGGTFTITNGGVFGSLLSTPILNPPQVAILGMHKIEQRPVALDGEVKIRPMMYVALSYDHRVIDGREAVQFLVRLKTLIEDPEALLLEG